MRGFIAAVAGTIAVMWCGAAVAEVNGPAITSHCTSAGAFGERFGASAVNGRPRSRLFNAQYVEIAPSFTPFTQAEVVFMQDSGRVHRVTGVATFANEADAEAAFAAAAGAFAQDPRFIPQPTGDDQSVAFHFADPDNTSGFGVELSVGASTLSLTCFDAALSQRATNEWRRQFGLGPTPSAAPAPPQEWSAAAIAQHQCTPDGAFGQQFGQRLRGRSRPGLTEHNRILTSRASFPPFQHFEATITPKTRVIQNMTARASFRDAAEASAAYAALVAAYESNGRFPHQRQDRLIGGPAGIAFSSDESSLVDYSLFVGLEGLEVRLVCSNNAILSQAFDEAFGRVD